MAKVVNETNEYFIIGFKVSRRDGPLYSYYAKRSGRVVFTFGYGVNSK